MAFNPKRTPPAELALSHAPTTSGELTAHLGGRSVLLAGARVRHFRHLTYRRSQLFELLQDRGRVRALPVSRCLPTCTCLLVIRRNRRYTVSDAQWP